METGPIIGYSLALQLTHTTSLNNDHRSEYNQRPKGVICMIQQSDKTALNIYHLLL